MRNTSAFDDGLEALGFEIVARNRGRLSVGVRSDLDAVKFVRAGRGTGRNHKGRHFLLLQRLGKRQSVSYTGDGRYLKHDGAPGNEGTINGRGGLRWFFRFRGNKCR